MIKMKRLATLCLAVVGLVGAKAHAEFIYRYDFEKMTLGDFTSQADANTVITNSGGKQSFNIIDTGKGNQELKISINEQNAGMAGIILQNLNIGEDFSVKQRVCIDNASRRIFFRLADQNLESGIDTLYYNQGEIYAYNGDTAEKIDAYRSGRYADIKITVDFDKSTYCAYIDGVLKVKDYKLSRDIYGVIRSINVIEVGHYFLCDTLIDNIEVYTLKDQITDTGVSDFYVSETGNNLNPGTKSRPFETIEAAKQKIAELLSLGIKRDFNVIIRGGTYDGVSFSDYDSPQDGYSITYKAYEGETVYITNSKLANNWVKQTGDIYKTNIGAGREVKTLYVDNSRAILARYPNTGYNTAVLSDVFANRVFNYNNGDVPSLSDWSGAEAVVWPGGPDGYWAWLAQIKGIEKIDTANKKVYLDGDCSYVIGTGSRYYFQNSKSFLDSENEFYYDRQTGDLYYQTSKDITKLEIRYDVNMNTMSADSLKSTKFQNLNFLDTDRNGDIFRLSGCMNITIEDCKLYNSGKNGVSIDKGCDGIKVKNCEISGIGYNAVVSSDSKYLEISQNHIHNAGEIYEHGCAIQLNDTSDSGVLNNTIHDIPRYGVSLKGVTYSSIKDTVIDGVKVTAENYEDFVKTKHNTVSGNDIYKVNTNSQDTGLIEMYGASQNTIVGNTLHDSDIPFSVGYGVYIDDSANHNTISKNLIYNLQKNNNNGILEYVIFTKGIGNVIRNNVLVNNKAYAPVGSSCHTPVNAHRELEITNNIFCNSGDDILYFLNWSDDRVAKCDNNLYYNKNGEYVLGGKGAPAKSFADWKKVYNNKFDQNSVTADPKFADPDNGDFRLLSSSPALALGFDNFLGVKKSDTDYEFKGVTFNKEDNYLGVRAGITKKYTDKEYTEISVAVYGDGNTLLYEASFKRVLPKDEDTYVRCGIDTTLIPDNARLNIYADEQVLYSRELNTI